MARTKKILTPKSQKHLAVLAVKLKTLESRLHALQRMVAREESDLQDLVKKRVTRAVKVAVARTVARYEARLASATSQTPATPVPSGTGRRKVRANGWSDSDIQFLHESLKAGKTVAELADALGRKVGAVRQRIHQQGISLRALRKGQPAAPKAKRALFGKRSRVKVPDVKPWSPEEFREVLGLLGSGMALKEVSEKINRPFRQVRQKLELEGVSLDEIRKEGTAPRPEPEDFFIQ